MSDFFIPYVRFLAGAALNIEQNLDGLHIWSVSFLQYDNQGKIVGSYMSPVEASVPIFLLLALLSILLSFNIIAAGFVIARQWGTALAVSLLFLPGFMSAAGYGHNITFGAKAYSIADTGNVGGVLGIIPLILMGIALGWSVIICLADFPFFGDRFRHIYDHLWYSLAVLAGIFFVVDSDSAATAKHFQEDTFLSRQASFYLLEQAAAYERHCVKDGLMQSASCKWSKDIQETLRKYWGEGLFAYKGSKPQNTRDIYDPFGKGVSEEETHTIRSEIKLYNESNCPVVNLGKGVKQFRNPNGICERPPAGFCRAYPDQFDGHVDHDLIGRPLAFASECVLPTLVLLRNEEEKTSEEMTENARMKHFRWLFFVGFSVLAGGKVANATARACKVDQRSPADQFRLFRLLMNCVKAGGRLTGWAMRAIMAAARMVLRAIAALARRVIP